MFARCSALPWKLLHPSVISRGSGAGIHLTFDDGPHPVGTPKLLNLLAIANAHSTFFVNGTQALMYPELLKRIATEGHTIGNHGQTHRSLLFHGRDHIRREIISADDSIQAVIGQAPRLLRPPFGYMGPNLVRVASELGKRIVLWSYDLRDFRAHGRNRRFIKAVDSISDGEILLLHDNEVTALHFESYLPKFLEALDRRGCHFTTLHS